MNKLSSGHGKSLMIGVILLFMATAGAVLIAFSKEIFPQNMFGGAARTVLVGFSAATLTGSLISFKNAVQKKRQSVRDK